MEELKEIIDPVDFESLESKLDYQWLNHKIKFRLMYLSDEDATIKVSQSWCGTGQHFDNNLLKNLTQEIFDPILLPRKIMVHTVAYIESPADTIDSVFLRKILSIYRITLKTMQAELGIHKTNISNWITGQRPMNKTTQNMFYWYFVSKGYIKPPMDQNELEDLSYDY